MLLPGLRRVSQPAYAPLCPPLSFSSSSPSPPTPPLSSCPSFPPAAPNSLLQPLLQRPRRLPRLADRPLFLPLSHCACWTGGQVGYEWGEHEFECLLCGGGSGALRLTCFFGWKARHAPSRSFPDDLGKGKRRLTPLPAQVGTTIRITTRVLTQGRILGVLETRIEDACVFFPLFTFPPLPSFRQRLTTLPPQRDGQTSLFWRAYEAGPATQGEAVEPLNSMRLPFFPPILSSFSVPRRLFPTGYCTASSISHKESTTS